MKDIDAKRAALEIHKLITKPNVFMDTRLADRIADIVWLAWCDTLPGQLRFVTVLRQTTTVYGGYDGCWRCQCGHFQVTRAAPSAQCLNCFRPCYTTERGEATALILITKTDHDTFGFKIVEAYT